MSQTLLIAYFFYGLSFFAMGLAMLLETGRSPALAEARSLRFLAAFGIIHGTHEWLESYLLQAEAAKTAAPEWLGWFKIVLLVSSFIALFLYAVSTLRAASPKYQGHRLVHFDRLIIYEAAIIMIATLTYRDWPIDWVTLLDGMARYLLAAPAAALAALSLYTQARKFRTEGRVPLAKPILMASLGFAIYTVGQVFVRPMDMFPAEYVNQALFLGITGIPIQILRTTASVIITVGLIQAMQIVESERQAQLVAAHDARVEALEERDALRRELLQHTVRSQEDERARIARELHDEIAQLLSAFSLELGALRSTVKSANTSRMVDHLQSLSRQMSQALFRLVRDLRPSQLDDLGLVPALNSLIGQDCHEKGMDVDFDVEGDPVRLNPLVETVLFRVAQEALNNVCRHAGVNKVKIDLRYQPEQVAIRITDRGVGFNPSEKFHPPRGWGLAGMRERVEALAGELTLRSAPGQGTTVEVVIPLKAGVGKEYEHGHNHVTLGG